MFRLGLPCGNRDDGQNNSRQPDDIAAFERLSTGRNAHGGRVVWSGRTTQPLAVQQGAVLGRQITDKAASRDHLDPQMFLGHSTGGMVTAQQENIAAPASSHPDILVVAGGDVEQIALQTHAGFVFSHVLLRAIC